MFESYSNFRIGTETGTKLIKYIMNRAQAYAEDNITELSMLDEINDIVQELNAIGGLKDSTEYGMSMVIPQTKYAHWKSNVLPGVQSEGDALGGQSTNFTGFNYNASTRVLTIPTSSAGLVWFGGAGFNSSWENGYVNLKVDGNVYQTSIESVSDTNNVVLKVASPAIPNIGPTAIKEFFASPDGQSDVIDISSIPLYKFIDYITSIHDDGLKKTCKKLDEVDFLNIRSNNDDNSPYAKSIIWFRKGGMIYMSKGSKIGNYGVRTMYLVRNPLPMEKEEDLIDVKPEHIGQVKALTIHRVLEKSKAREMPADIQQAYEGYLAQQKAAYDEKKTNNDKR